MAASVKPKVGFSGSGIRAIGMCVIQTNRLVKVSSTKNHVAENMFGNIPGRTLGRKGEEATTCGPAQPAELQTHASTVHWSTQPRDSPPRLLAAWPGHHSRLPQSLQQVSQPRAPAWGTAARLDQTSALLFLSPFLADGTADGQRAVPNQSLRPSPSLGMFAQELSFFSAGFCFSPQGRLPQCRSPLCPKGPVSAFPSHPRSHVGMTGWLQCVTAFRASGCSGG